MALRPVWGTMYIDESGAAVPVTDPSLAEVNAVGAIAIPGNSLDRDALIGFVGDVMARRFGDRSIKGEKLKVAQLEDGELERLADLIRLRPWYVVHESLPPNTPSDNLVWHELWDKQREMLTVAFRKVRRSSLDMATVAQLLADHDEMRAKHPMWSWLVFRAMDMMAQLFRINNTIPTIRVIIDEHGGHTEEQKRYLQFLCRFAFASHFPELFGTRLAAVLGLTPDFSFVCRTSDDETEDGLLLADLIASASRTLRRNADKGGRIARFFERCSVANK